MENKKLKEKLRHSEERFRIALKNSPITLIELDCDLRFKWIYNPLIPRRAEEIIGKKIGEIGITKDVTPLKDFYNEVLKTATAKRTEIKLEYIDREAYYDIYAEPLRDETGKVIGLMSTSTDITERKKTEEALKESEERMRAIAETAIIDISVSRLSDGVVLFTNAAYDETFGFNRGELIGFHAPNLYVNQKDRERLINILNKEGFVKDYQVKIKRKDGTPIWVAASVSIIHFGGEPALLAVSIDITKRKQAEEALKESEQLYRTLFDNSEDGFQLVQPIYNDKGKAVDFLFLKVNSAYERQTGLKAANIVGKTVKQIVHNIEQYWIDICGDVDKTGKPKRYENFNQYADKWFDVYHFPYAKGKVGVLFRDITERKKTEEALTRSSRRINVILESISDDFMELDHNWNYVYANGQAAKLVGLEPKEIVGKNFWQLFPQNKGTYIEQNLRQAMEKREIRRFEISGQYSGRHKLISIYPSVDGIVLIATDITERKLLEQALKLRTDELACERQRFYNMIEDMPVMVCLLTPDYQVAYGNRMFRETFGESQGKPCYVYCGGQNAPCSMCESFLPLKTGKAHHWVANFPNGKIIEVYDYPFTDVDGKKMVLEVDIDITERTKLEKQLQESERMAAIGQTAGMVGHDLRNPLQTIVGELYLAETELAEMPKSQEKDSMLDAIHSISEQISYMDKIVSDLQTFVKPVNPNIQTVELSPLIVTLLAQINIPANITTSMQITNTFTVEADPQLLKRVFINLVTNAIQAMPQGGELTIKAKRVNQKRTQISVNDTGIGIPDEIKPKLFTPLFTTKSKGQGFGLAVCKRVLEAQNGTISFESQEGKGTTFTVELPNKPFS